MKRGGQAALVIAVVLLVVATASISSAPTASSATKSSRAFTTVTLLIRHRVFPNFRDRQQVTLNKEFIIGDTDYSGRVVRYVPDFTMDMKTRAIKSRSDEPKNPAFEVIVKQSKTPQDTSWAFLRVPPHFARKSMLSFQILRIDFPNRAPLINADSTAKDTPARSAAPVQIQPSHGSASGTSPH